MKLKYVFLLWGIVTSVAGYAYDFSAKDSKGVTFYYNITSEEEKTVEITNEDEDGGSYSGVIDVPSEVIYNNVEYRVTAIGEEAFIRCYELTGINFHPEIIEIGKYAFAVCTKLTSIILPDEVTSLTGTFLSCPALQHVVLPKKLKGVGKETFAGCQSLSTLEFPDSFAGIGDYSFMNTGFTHLVFPEGFKDIGQWAFAHSKKLTSVEFPKGMKSIGELIFIHTNLTAVYVHDPEPVPLCVDPFGVDKAILYVPMGSKQFYSKALYWARFKDITELPEELKIGDTFQIKNLIYRVSGDSELSICGIDDSHSQTYADPISELRWNNKEYQITSFDEACFLNSKVTSVHVPNSVRHIGDNAFAGCENLFSFWLSETESKLEHIGTEAFLNCKILQKVTIPEGIASIEEGTFAGCSKLPSAVIPESVNRIGNAAFADCSSFTSIHIPNHVSSIGNQAFTNCTNLTELIIGEGTIIIGQSAFAGCSELISVCFPDKAITIGEKAFHRCTALTSLELPGSVAAIEEYAFEGCTGLTSIKVTESPIPLGKDAFVSSLSNATLYVPVGYKGIYSSAPEWSKFARIVEYGPLQTTCTDGKNIRVRGNVTTENYPQITQGLEKSGITSIDLRTATLEEEVTLDLIREELNPNCLIYISESEDQFCGENIVQGGMATKIMLTDAYDFYCPDSFRADEASYTRSPSRWASNNNGWETIVLPFEVRQYEASINGKITPVTLEKGGNFWLRMLNGSEEGTVHFQSTTDAVMKANTPYIIAFPGAQFGKNSLEGEHITFSATQCEIGATPDRIAENSLHYFFSGTYETVSTSGWMLNETGDEFQREEFKEILPFHAYFTAVPSNTSLKKRLAIGNGVPSSLDAPDMDNERNSELQFIRTGNGIQIIASTAQKVTVYNAAGIPVLQSQLEEGENRLETLPQGIYIINTQKFVIR